MSISTDLALALSMADNDLQNQFPPSGQTPAALPIVPAEPAAPPSLSDRELQVIELVTRGLTNEQIAEKLEISKRTVDNHISNILTKTGTQNRVALVTWAVQLGKVCIDGLNCCPLPPFKG
jgi:DNA-binding NarL/FixJ family response regulator